MDPGTITLDRESFRALASEVRVEILKQLGSHRMTVTDLSHSMSLAKPTLLEHLDRLVTAGLVSKVDEGRKWIYYELTKRGRTILHPHQVKIMISLAISLLLFSAGMVAVLNAASTYAGQTLGGSEATQTGGPLTGFDRGITFVTTSGPAGIGLILFGIGGAMLGLALAFWYAQRTVIGSVRRDLAAA